MIRRPARDLQMVGTFILRARTALPKCCTPCLHKTTVMRGFTLLLYATCTIREAASSRPITPRTSLSDNLEDAHSGRPTADGAAANHEFFAQGKEEVDTPPPPIEDSLNGLTAFWSLPPEGDEDCGPSCFGEAAAPYASAQDRASIPENSITEHPPASQKQDVSRQLARDPESSTSLSQTEPSHSVVGSLLDTQPRAHHRKQTSLKGDASRLTGHTEQLQMQEREGANPSSVDTSVVMTGSSEGSSQLKDLTQVSSLAEGSRTQGAKSDTFPHGAQLTDSRAAGTKFSQADQHGSRPVSADGQALTAGERDNAHSAPPQSSPVLRETANILRSNELHTPTGALNYEEFKTDRMETRIPDEVGAATDRTAAGPKRSAVEHRADMYGLALAGTSLPQENDSFTRLLHRKPVQAADALKSGPRDAPALLRMQVEHRKADEQQLLRNMRGELRRRLGKNISGRHRWPLSDLRVDQWANTVFTTSPESSTAAGNTVPSTDRHSTSRTLSHRSHGIARCTEGHEESRHPTHRPRRRSTKDAGTLRKSRRRETPTDDVKDRRLGCTEGHEESRHPTHRPRRRSTNDAGALRKSRRRETRTDDVKDRRLGCTEGHEESRHPTHRPRRRSTKDAGTLRKSRRRETRTDDVKDRRLGKGPRRLRERNHRHPPEPAMREEARKQAKPPPKAYIAICPPAPTGHSLSAHASGRPFHKTEEDPKRRQRAGSSALETEEVHASSSARPSNKEKGEWSSRHLEKGERNDLESKNHSQEFNYGRVIDPVSRGSHKLRYPDTTQAEPESRQDTPEAPLIGSVHFQPGDPRSQHFDYGMQQKGQQSRPSVHGVQLGRDTFVLQKHLGAFPTIASALDGNLGGPDMLTTGRPHEEDAPGVAARPRSHIWFGEELASLPDVSHSSPHSSGHRMDASRLYKPTVTTPYVDPLLAATVGRRQQMARQRSEANFDTSLDMPRGMPSGPDVPLPVGTAEDYVGTKEGPEFPLADGAPDEGSGDIQFLTRSVPEVFDKEMATSMTWRTPASEGATGSVEPTPNVLLRINAENHPTTRLAEVEAEGDGLAKFHLTKSLEEQFPEPTEDKILNDRLGPFRNGGVDDFPVEETPDVPSYRILNSVNVQESDSEASRSDVSLSPGSDLDALLGEFDDDSVPSGDARSRSEEDAVEISAPGGSSLVEDQDKNPAEAAGEATKEEDLIASSEGSGGQEGRALSLAKSWVQKLRTLEAWRRHSECDEKQLSADTNCLLDLLTILEDRSFQQEFVEILRKDEELGFTLLALSGYDDGRPGETLESTLDEIAADLKTVERPLRIVDALITMELANSFLKILHIYAERLLNALDTGSSEQLRLYLREPLQRRLSSVADQLASFVEDLYLLSIPGVATLETQVRFFENLHTLLATYCCHPEFAFSERKDKELPETLTGTSFRERPGKLAPPQGVRRDFTTSEDDLLNTTRGDVFPPSHEDIERVGEIARPPYSYGPQLRSF